jgi:hypothetical protein
MLRTIRTGGNEAAYIYACPSSSVSFPPSFATIGAFVFAPDDHNLQVQSPETAVGSMLAQRPCISMVRMSRSRRLHVSAVAGSTSTPSYAYSRVQKDNREPRAENTAGNFWVDHTCIGECIMHLLRHPKRRQSCRLPNAPDKCLLLSCLHARMLSRPGHHAMHVQTRRVAYHVCSYM